MSEFKKTSLYEEHVKLSAKMVPFAGFEMPVKYSSELEEHKSVRNNAGLFDVSHMGEFEVTGSKALDLIQYVTSNDASKLVDGQAQYSCLMNSDGGIVDDLLIYRFSDTKYWMVVNAANIEKDWEWVVQHNHVGANITNISNEVSQIALQGPKSQDILSALTNTDLGALKHYHFSSGEIDNIGDVIISKTGYTGAGGFELYISNKQAPMLWQQLLEAGHEHGLKPAGLGARDTLRLEMGFCLYGNDLDDSTSPIEAGLGWITKLTKDFIGKEHLVKQKEEGVVRKLVGIKLLDKGIARAGYQVNVGDAKAGIMTSGTISPILQAGIGLAYIHPDYAKVGTELDILVRNRSIKGQVVKPPFLS